VQWQDFHYNPGYNPGLFFSAATKDDARPMKHTKRILLFQKNPQTKTYFTRKSVFSQLKISRSK